LKNGRGGECRCEKKKRDLNMKGRLGKKVGMKTEKKDTEKLGREGK
jgi:hypothetical protein